MSGRGLDRSDREEPIRMNCQPDISAPFEPRGFEKVLELERQSKPAEAMRFNTGKPKLSYLLTFQGQHSDDIALNNLAQWYRGELNTRDLTEIVRDAIQDLDSDPDFKPCEAMEQQALVSMFGEQKYARGNYLLGRNWSDTIDSLMRHRLKRTIRGEEFDDDSKLKHIGHERWNWCYLLHCVLTMPERDDRIRAPEIKK